MIIIARDVTDPLVPPFLTALGFITNADGTMAVQMAENLYAFQQPSNGGPSTYGQFGRTPTPDGAYQECKVAGQLVSFWTRGQDLPYVYTWMTVPTR